MAVHHNLFLPLPLLPPIPVARLDPLTSEPIPNILILRMRNTPLERAFLDVNPASLPLRLIHPPSLYHHCPPYLPRARLERAEVLPASSMYIILVDSLPVYEL